jgi:hypothetical protein
MSEQLVDKLLKQSRTEYWTQYTPSYDYEKFAELIVRETLRVTGATPSQHQTALRCFGVED